MTTIVGIDSSMTSTGLARITTNGLSWHVETSCRTSKPTGTTLTDRWLRITTLAADVAAFTLPCDLVVIEGPSFGSRGAGTWDRAWLWGSIVARILQHGTPLVQVAPTSRAKFTAATGRADKAAVALAAARMWPAWTPGTPDGVNDQADALALASIGVPLAGLRPPFPMPQYRTQTLAKLAAANAA